MDEHTEVKMCNEYIDVVLELDKPNSAALKR